MTDPLRLDSFGERLNVAVIGASGGIGNAFADQLENCASVATVGRLSRSKQPAAHNKSRALHLDLRDEDSIAAAAADLERSVGELHLVLVATGVLHDGDTLQPEKTWRALSGAALENTFRINTIGPSLVAKHFLPLLAPNRKTAFAALSARVGSIEDNRLGGWHAYRASKAALNMIIKTLSIELSRRNPLALCVGLHPGTVETALSDPFKAGVPNDALFQPAYAAGALLKVLDALAPDASGNLYAWDGARIPF